VAKSPAGLVVRLGQQSQVFVIAREPTKTAPGIPPPPLRHNRFVLRAGPSLVLVFAASCSLVGEQPCSVDEDCRVDERCGAGFCERGERAPPDAGPPAPDAGPPPLDAGPPAPDAGPTLPDAGLIDAGLPDAGAPDAGVDAGREVDAGDNDAGVDAGPEPFGLEVGADEQFSCGVDDQGVLSCWGVNDQGQLGRGVAGGSSPTPIAVPNLPPVREVDLGAFNVWAVDDDGNVHCFGDNDDLQCGQAGGGDLANAVQVPGLSNIVEVAGGGFHGCARDDEGRVFCLGRNSDGQCGINSAGADVLTANEVSLPAPAVAIAAGGFHSLAVLSDGRVFGWGRNDDGQLFSSGASSAAPVELTGAWVGDIIDAGGGDFFTCVLTDAGEAWCAGRGAQGQLGDDNGVSSDTAVQVSGLVGATEIATGDRHACAVVGVPREVWCWGENDPNERLGVATVGNALTPVQTEVPTPARGLALGGAHSCAVVDDSRVVCWGSNSVGQSGPNGAAVGVVEVPLP
jgi:alpha-tubulin suppressor-like RCC1 family protein